MNSITPQRLDEAHNRGEPIRLVDVRTPAEFLAAHVPFSENLPLDSLDPAEIMSAGKRSSTGPIYVICQSGGRSAKACARLAAAGFSDVVNVEGGTSAWEQVGLPVVRGRQTISLERQVRIVAGSLVLTGSLLGFFVHPYFIALVAFVGAGLAFAGITDTCGMGMLLARMPWNQAGSTSKSSSA